MDSLLRLGPPLLLAASVGCVRPQLGVACPQIQAGDLALTELRQNQPGSYRQWIELYNASDEPIALAGLRFQFTRNDGVPAGSFFVRDEALEVEPGGYVVLGSDDPMRAAYLDYSYLVDWHSATDASQPRDLPSGGLVEVTACGRLIDRVVLRNLTAEGTMFWPGEPDAAGNDEGADWCVDNFTTSTGLGLYGTPGEVNPACP
ncbi:lamin tail domain-containing protein [Nannocystis radixulma]|uniref:Lamin tail domain-containing protein n=1 Tax=Nannocystis radixulma TaxID=2995305 RepID=A0ABT5B026_9BACT|nr:lamin tail domain-containing protein [Nannocystis radixulma]MDC0667045.1 lamin tail domain-containing protein [Nannocystis radixulma]